MIQLEMKSAIDPLKIWPMDSLRLNEKKQCTHILESGSTMFILDLANESSKIVADPSI